MLFSLFSVSTDADDRRVRTAGAIILQISYGYAIQEENDPFVKLAEETMDQFSLATAPVAFWSILYRYVGLDSPSRSHRN